jgi:hypothetical protein
VRDQYLMEVASRCRLEPDLLRSGRLRAQSPRQDSPSRPRPMATRIRLPTGPEEQALLLAVHRRGEVLHRLHESLFVGEETSAAFRALVDADDLHGAIADAGDPEVASLLQRLAVEDDEEVNSDDVLARVAREAALRAASAFRAEMQAAADPAPYSDVLRWLQECVELLAEDETRVDATEQLVAWLAKRAEEQG